jgi:hypothetical protein
MPSDVFVPLSHLADLLSDAFGTVKFRQVSRILKRKGENSHLPLLDLEVDPSQYSCPEKVYLDWMAVNLFRKCESLNTGIDTKEAAWLSFYESEAKCKRTNRRLEARYDTPTLGVSGESLLHAARLKIASVLGDFSWNECAEFFGFSSGATTARKRVEGDPWYKYQATLDVTSESYQLALCAIFSTPRWREHLHETVSHEPSNWLRVVPGNRVETVPKNAKTDRMIAVEPCMNMHMQLGVGQVIRRKLRAVGINLNDQSWNQVFARLGSRTGSYATLDLKAASDTISIAIVRSLLPPDWFEALDMLRSKRWIDADGRVHSYRKFSSMGNGFTFELETLIFWALASAVVDSYDGEDNRVLAYGDDLIVPTAAAGFVTELLEYCGFSLNLDKSFVTGPFRESCGKHYFRGIDITPVYCKKALSGLAEVYWCVNSLRYWSARQTGICDPRINHVIKALTKRIPREFRSLKVPASFSLKAGIHSDFTEATPRHVRNTRHGVTGWRVRYYQMNAGKPVSVDGRAALLRARQGVPLKHQWDEEADLVTHVAEEMGFSSTMEYFIAERQVQWSRLATTAVTAWIDPPLMVNLGR